MPVQPLPSPEPALESIASACARLDLSRGMINKLLREGEIESVKIGRARRILSSSVDDLIRRRRTPSSAERNGFPAEAAAVLVSRTCSAQGFEVEILDPEVLKNVAAVVRAGRTQARAAS